MKGMHRPQNVLRKLMRLMTYWEMRKRGNCMTGLVTLLLTQAQGNIKAPVTVASREDFRAASGMVSGAALTPGRGEAFRSIILRAGRTWTIS